MATKAPTTEIGTPFSAAQLGMPAAFLTGGGGPRIASGQELQQEEPNSAWKWPNRKGIVDAMLMDSQAAGLYEGSTMPVLRYTYRVNPNGAPDACVKLLAEDLGLPIKGRKQETVPRRGGRFSFFGHLAEALYAPLYGFYDFEQYGKVENNPATPSGKAWRLRKLAARTPYSIQEICADAQDGGLVGIRQNGIPDIITVDRIVHYVWGKRGANWYGNSLFRPIYGDWVEKDKLRRIDVFAAQNGGMGVPVAKGIDPDVTPQALQAAAKIAAAWRTGEGASAGMPTGTDIDFKGPSGTTDVIAKIRYRDEQMAKRFFRGFQELGMGGGGGAYALGAGLIDWATFFQESIANWFVGNFNEHVIEDWVDWNFGEGTPAPIVEWDREFDNSYSVTDIVALITAGAITVDNETEAWLREMGGAPELSKAFERDPEQIKALKQAAIDAAKKPDTPQDGQKADPKAVDGAEPGNTSGKDVKASNGALRRPLNEHEIRASTDFNALDQVWRGSLATLMDRWVKIKEKQLADLETQIAASDTMKDLTTVSPQTLGREAILDALITVATHGVESAATEARAQGINRPVMPVLEDLMPQLEDRADAVAELMARSLGEAGARRATQLGIGAGSDPEEVAGYVREYLTGLSGAFLEEQFGGALTAAQNQGRGAVFNANPPDYLYASEILDSSTCDECKATDGKEYKNMTEAQKDYPTGGNARCKGRGSCRGGLVGVWGE